jgi:hypothetical protein
MSLPDTRLRVTTLLLAALTALLIFATASSAEIRTGESTTVESVEGSPSAEATLVKSSASYDTSNGAESFTVTTAARPSAETGGKPSTTLMAAEAVSDPSGCKDPKLLNGIVTPMARLINIYGNPASAEGLFIESPLALPVALPTVMTVSGATTTLSTTSSEIEDQSFNCAVVSVGEEDGAGSFMIFPLTAPPEPPHPPASAPPAPPTPAPAASVAPGPPVLSIVKPKPLKVRVGKSKTVQIKVSNTGGTATARGTLRVKGVKGVLVKPETQKLSALAPGASRSVSVRLEVTEEAKEKSTLSVTGTASGATAKASLVVERTE